MKRRKSNLDTNHKCQGYQPFLSIIPCFGHKDIHYRVTYLYIRPENKLVDEANRKVIDYINGNLR